MNEKNKAAFEGFYKDTEQCSAKFRLGFKHGFKDALDYRDEQIKGLVEALETLDALWQESVSNPVDFSHAIDKARAALASYKEQTK